MSDMKVRLRLQAKDEGLKATVSDAAQSVDELSGSAEKLDQETKQATDSQDKFGDSAKKSGKKVRDASDSNAQASKSTADFSSKLKGGAVTAGVWAAATVAAGVAAAGMVAIVRTDAIREIKNLSDTLNVSTASLTEWQYAAGQMGLEGDKVGDIFKDVSDKVGDFVTTGGGEAADIFENLNVQVKELQTLSPDEQLLKIAGALDDVNRNQQIFFLESIADDASRLLPLLDNGAQRLIAMRQEARVLGVSISDIDADVVSQAAGEMSRLKALGEGAANSLAIEFAPILSAVSGGIVDWVVQAGGFRDAIRWTIDASVTSIGVLLDTGRQVEVWLTTITSYVLQFATYATQGMDAYADAITTVLNTAMYPFQQAYGTLFGLIGDTARALAGWGGPLADDLLALADGLDASSQKIKDFRIEAEDVAGVNDTIAASYQTVQQRLAELLTSDDPSAVLKQGLADLRAEMEETAKANQRLKEELNDSPDQGIKTAANSMVVQALQDELDLLRMTERERAITTQTRKLDNQATAEQVIITAQLAAQIYDVAAAQKAATDEQAAFKKQLDDANTAAQRFLQDGNLGEIEGLESIQEQLRDAMSVKGITADMEADFSEAIDKIQSRIGELKFNNMVDGLSSGISALQGLTEQGSDSYQKMQIALTAFNVVQGVSAVLKQLSEGDPYTAFARAGATLAAVAQLGVAINGGGGLDVSAQRQASQGTSTVLGDASAKSESILKSNELIAEAVEEIVGINRSMLDALLNLEVSINGAALQITRRWDDTVASPQNIELGGISSVSGLFSSISESLNILDLGGLIADIAGASVKGKDSGLVLEAPNLTNISAQSYATWEERKNWLDDYDTKWQFTDLDPQITQQLRLVIGGIADSVSAGADQLGMSGAAIDQAIQSFALERTLISLKGLTADEQQEELQAVFSAMFDDMSMHVMPWLVEFQQAGEGLGETLSRLATEASAVDNVVGMLGLTFGDVDDKLRAQTYLVSAMGGLEEFVSAYSSFADKFLSEEQQFANARDQLQSAFAQYDVILPASREDYLALVQAQDAATDAGAKNIAKLFELSDAAGEYYSMLEDREDERVAALQQYQSIYYSESEKTEQLRTQLATSFAELNVQMPDTREQFRALVDSMDTTTDAGQETYDALLDLAPEFANLNSTMQEAAYSADNLAERIENALNPKTDQQVQNEALGILGFGGLSIEQAMAQLNALGTAGLETLKSQLSISDTMFEETVGTIINAYTELQTSIADEVEVVEEVVEVREREYDAIDRSNALLEQRNKALEEEQARLDALAGIDQGFARLGLTFEEVMTQAIGDMIDNVQDRLAQVGGTDGLLESGIGEQILQLLDVRIAAGRAEGYQSMISQINAGVTLASAKSQLDQALIERRAEQTRLQSALNILDNYKYPKLFDTDRLINPTDELVDAIHDIQKFMGASHELPSMDALLSGMDVGISYISDHIAELQSGELLRQYQNGLAETLSLAGADSASELRNHEASLVNEIREIEASFSGLVRFLDDNGNVYSDIANELALSKSELDQLATEFRDDFQDAFASSMDIDLKNVGDIFNGVAEKWADVIYTQEERLDIQLEALRDKLVAFDELGISSATTVSQFKSLFEAAQKTASGAELGHWWAAADVFADINTTLDAIANLNPEDVASQFPEVDALEQYLSSVQSYVEQQLKDIESSYREQLRTLEEQARVGKELRDYVTQIRISDLSPDGPAEKLNAAQENLAALMVKAEAGDLEAGRKLQSAADSYLSLADAYYGRTDAYTNLFNEVTQSLDSLGLDWMDASSQSVVEQLNADMLSEQQQIKDYAAQELDWAIEQSNALTGIEGLLSDWPEQFASIMENTANLIADSVAVSAPIRPSMAVISGSHANGLDHVPYDNYLANLHKGEMILTADVANHVRRSMTNSSNSNSNSNTGAIIAVLQSELVQLRASVDLMTQTTVQTSKTAEGQRSQQLKATEKVARNQRPKVGLNA